MARRPYPDQQRLQSSPLEGFAEIDKHWDYSLFTIHVFAGDSVARSGFERVPSLLSNSSFRVEAQSQL